jgi:hypothetical protein
MTAICWYDSHLLMWKPFANMTAICWYDSHLVPAAIYSNNKCTGKAVPSQTWSCPGGSRKLSIPDCMTTAQEGGKVVSLTHRPPLPPANAPGTHFC